MKSTKILSLALSALIPVISVIQTPVFAAANKGFSDAEIAAADPKPVITVSKVVVPGSAGGSTQTVTITLSGADGTTIDHKWANSGIHIYYDNRLQISTKSNGFSSRIN